MAIVRAELARRVHWPLDVSNEMETDGNYGEDERRQLVAGVEDELGGSGGTCSPAYA